MVIKGQTLDDFVAEFTYDIPPESKKGLPEVETPKQSNSDDPSRWKLFVDGSLNQHSCGAWLILQTPSGEQKKYAIRIGFKATNNKAEYKALLVGLRVAIEMEVDFLDAFSDSQLVVNQVQRDFEVSWSPLKMSMMARMPDQYN